MKEGERQEEGKKGRGEENEKVCLVACQVPGRKRKGKGEKRAKRSLGGLAYRHTKVLQMAVCVRCRGLA